MSTEKSPSWGETGEREEAARREEALASLPPEMREGGAKLLAACEGDPLVWAYTVALMALGVALRGEKEGEQAGERAGERAAIKLDLAKEVLKFWRAACGVEQVDFVLKKLAPAAPDKETLCASIAYGHVSGTQALQKHAERIKLLVAALQGGSS